uniref:AP2/ERF domain-containing protein n=1 Tax=Leishmania utingensis TaxID=653362 RepID=A0AAW3A8D9_9TRYP
MQYHVPFGLAHLSASSAASSSMSSVQASSSPVHHQEIVSDSGVGITVGQGLLGGRHLAVRVTPPLASSTFSPADIPAGASGDIRGAASHWHSGYSSSGRTHSSVCASFSGHATLEPPGTTTNTTTGTANHTSSSAYGAGIVRISELRRQGVTSIESGLRLATLQGGRSVAPAKFTHRIDSAHGGASSDGGVIYGSLMPDATPSLRRTRRRGSPVPATTTLATASSSARVHCGRSSTVVSGGGRRRGRGRRRSSSSQASAAVTLRNDGQLCDYRWYTARGRRCFVYDGRTYKGSSADRMWEKVKEAARQRGLLQSQQAVAASRVSAAPRARGRADSDSTYSTAAACVTVPRSHQASPRARFATEQALLIQRTKQRSTSVPRKLIDEPTGAGVPTPTRLPEEWRTLMEELGVLPDEDTGAMEIDREGRPLSVMDEKQPLMCTPTNVSRNAQLRRDHLSAGSAATKDVIEISDSDSTSEGTNDSDPNTSSSSSLATLSTEARNYADRGQRNTDTVVTGEPLQWPVTSYFSDASSGWSSTSSFTTSPAPSPSSKSRNSPKRKRVRPEQCTGQAATATPCAPARLCRYHGVQVVEQEGWVYPVEVYASQQQQKQQRDRESEEGRKTTPRLASPGVFLPAASVSRTGVSGDCSSVPCGVDDLPLADLYREASTAQSGALVAAQPCRRTLLTVPLPSFNASAGLSVVSETGAAVPIRPVTLSSTVHASLLNRSAALQSNVSGGGFSAFLGADDNLDDFHAADLVDMFVTGEEIGGLRYEG